MQNYVLFKKAGGSDNNFKKISMTHSSYECCYGLISTWFINVIQQKTVNPSLHSAVKLPLGIS